MGIPFGVFFVSCGTSTDHSSYAVPSLPLLQRQPTSSSLEHELGYSCFFVGGLYKRILGHLTLKPTSPFLVVAVSTFDNPESVIGGRFGGSFLFRNVFLLFAKA